MDPDIEELVSERFDALSAEDVAHLLEQKRWRSKEDYDRRAEQVAAWAELRDTWRATLADRPALGAFDQSLAEQPPPPREVMARACQLTVDDEAVPLHVALSELADFFLEMGADPDEIEHAFSGVLEDR